MNTGGNICSAAVSAVLSALFLSSNLPLSVGSSRTASRKAYFATSVCRHVLRGFQGHLSAQVLGRGAPDRFLDRLDLRGWNTFANFAHAPTATPGTAGAEAAVKVVLDAVLGETFAVHEAAFRRLHWEAWTLTAADLKREVDGTDEATPRKLPVAEIGARHHALRHRGVCYAVAELMTFEVHETLIQFLFKSPLRATSASHWLSLLFVIVRCT